MRPLEAVLGTHRRLGEPRPRSRRDRHRSGLPTRRQRSRESAASRTSCQVVRSQLRRESSSSDGQWIRQQRSRGQASVRRTQLTVCRRSNCVAWSVARTIAKLSPSADSGKAPTARPRSPCGRRDWWHWCRAVRAGTHGASRSVCRGHGSAYPRVVGASFLG